MRHKTVTIFLTIRVRGHFVMSVKKNHESHYVTVLDNSLHDSKIVSGQYMLPRCETRLTKNVNTSLSVMQEGKPFIGNFHSGFCSLPNALQFVMFRLHPVCPHQATTGFA